ICTTAAHAGHHRPERLPAAGPGIIQGSCHFHYHSTFFRAIDPMRSTPIKSVLEHQVPVGEPVTVQGWVRSRRTSKGGFSFIHVNDGTCLDSLQIVAGESLGNYQNEVVELSTGCAVRVAGT